ncbi:unnamed protein product [Diplocarpon coronariae]|uniref:asparagine--tRNA ligase n=1 Tax=Diplocarpon coronariae TaxID=2795749 RepID=A0A218Z729_9HELO|nr:asparaginyl-tRNA synthetase [Marssonina coronariae]
MVQLKSRCVVRGITKASTHYRQLHTRSAHQSHGIAHLLDNGAADASRVAVNGFVRSVRVQKKLAFANIVDGTTNRTLQAVLTHEQAQSLATGAAVRLTGAWTPSVAPGARQSHELVVEDVSMFGSVDPTTYPLQKKWHTPEFLRTMPHLRVRTQANSTLLRLRSDAIAAVTDMFYEAGFTQTHTPIITSSDCEGAGEVFHVGSAQQNKKPKKGDDGTFFKSKKYLTVSSQLHLEALAQSAGKVWTLSPTFRAEKSDTARHLSEFYMLEAELNFTEDMEDVMKVLQNTVCSITEHLLSGSKAAMELMNFMRWERKAQSGLKSKLPKGNTDEEQQMMRRWRGGSQQFHRITYTDAIKLLRASLRKFEHEPKWGLGLQAEHERYIASTLGETTEAIVPVFVTHYPRAVKPFYMLPSSTSEEGRETVDCFDLLVPDACEIAGGSMREHRLEPLIKSMQAHHMIPSDLLSTERELGDLEWYVDLRRWGSAPHGGFGLGFDRLLGYLANVPNIREVVAFPRWVGRCDC